MKKLIAVAFGIMTAFGGFLDFGQIVFTMQAGAVFNYRLIWAVIPGTLAIIVYMEMCGRVAVVAHTPVFSIVRDQFGSRWGLVVLIASNLLTLITCAAELGGVAITLQLLTGWPPRLLLLAAALLIAASVAFLKFDTIEQIYGLAGLMMIVFTVSVTKFHPDAGAILSSFIPRLTSGAPNQNLRYYYFAVGIFSAMLMEYEVHFYSSGAIEEDWKPKDLSQNFFVAALGSVLGAVLTIGLVVLGALVFLPRGIYPTLLSTAALAAALPLGPAGLTLALCGILACLAGATVETALASGYNLCEFFNLPWGKNLPAAKVPAFAVTWAGTLALAVVLIFIGIDPLQLVNISVIFGMVLMPLTYYPILRVAMDKRIMGKHVNSRLDTLLGGTVLVLIVIAAVSAIPLMIVTDSGKP